MKNNSNFEEAMECIGQSLFEIFDKNTPKEVVSLLNNIREAYVIVQWPESQELMEKEWFNEEAILDTEGKFGSSAYFVPLKRVI